MKTIALILFNFIACSLFSQNQWKPYLDSTVSHRYNSNLGIYEPYSKVLFTYNDNGPVLESNYYRFNKDSARFIHTSIENYEYGTQGELTLRRQSLLDRGKVASVNVDELILSDSGELLNKRFYNIFYDINGDSDSAIIMFEYDGEFRLRSEVSYTYDGSKDYDISYYYSENGDTMRNEYYRADMNYNLYLVSNSGRINLSDSSYISWLNRYNSDGSASVRTYDTTYIRNGGDVLYSKHWNVNETDSFIDPQIHIIKKITASNFDETGEYSRDLNSNVWDTISFNSSHYNDSGKVFKTYALKRNNNGTTRDLSMISFNDDGSVSEKLHFTQTLSDSEIRPLSKEIFSYEGPVTMLSFIRYNVDNDSWENMQMTIDSVNSRGDKKKTEYKTWSADEVDWITTSQTYHYYSYEETSEITGIEIGTGKEQINFSIYPSLSSNYIKISVDGFSSSSTVKIYNMLGKEVLQESNYLTDEPIFIGNLNAGAYKVFFFSGNMVFSGDFLKD